MLTELHSIPIHFNNLRINFGCLLSFGISKQITTHKSLSAEPFIVWVNSYLRHILWLPMQQILSSCAPIGDCSSQIIENSNYLVKTYKTNYCLFFCLNWFILTLIFHWNVITCQNSSLCIGCLITVFNVRAM